MVQLKDLKCYYIHQLKVSNNLGDDITIERKPIWDLNHRQHAFILQTWCGSYTFVARILCCYICTWCREKDSERGIHFLHQKHIFIHPEKYLEKLFCYFHELFTCYKRVYLILQFTDNRRMCIDRILSVMWVWYFAEILTVYRNAAFINWWLRITFRKLVRTGKVVSDFLQYYQFTKTQFLLISLLALSCHATWRNRNDSRNKKKKIVSFFRCWGSCTKCILNAGSLHV